MTTPTKERRLASRRERLAWKVWGYVRDNARSLAAENHMRWIEEALEEELEDSEQRIADIQRKLDAAEATIQILTRGAPKPNGEKNRVGRAGRISANQAIWAVEMVAGLGVYTTIVAKALKVEPATISKICTGVVWGDETAKARAKYAKLDSDTMSVQAR